MTPRRSQPPISDSARGSWPTAIAGVGAGVVACLAVGALGSWVLGRRPIHAQHWWLSEAGAIEIAAAAGYAVLTTALLATALFGRRMGRPAPVPRPWLLAACVACLGLRELDWHKLWTTRDIFKTRLYVDPEIGVAEKLAAAAAVGFVVALFVTAARRCGPILVRRLRAGSAAATCTTVALALLVVGKVLDAGVRLWRKHVADVTPQDERYVGFVEEIAELCVPLLLITALALAWRASRPAADVARSLPPSAGSGPDAAPA